LADLASARGIVSGQYYDPIHVASAEVRYRAVIEIDPTNLAAHRELATLANLRAFAAQMDMTALLSDDERTLLKSTIAYAADSSRRATALAAYDDLIEERRIMASELRPNDPVDAVALVDAYTDRQNLLIVSLYDRETTDPSFRTDGERIVSDAARVRTWTNQLLAAESPATRAERIDAWAERLEAINHEWNWYGLLVQDEAKATELGTEFRQAARDAVAYIESAPLADDDEAYAASDVYFFAEIVADRLDDDRLAAVVARQKVDDLRAQVSASEERVKQHSSSQCLEERERQAGDELAAAGDFAAARLRYESALEANPNHVASLTNLSWTLYQLGDVAGAMGRARTAVQLDPNNPVGWANLGVYGIRSGDDGVAAGAYDRFFAIVATYPPEQRMAMVRTALGDLQDLLATDASTGERIRPVLSRFQTALNALDAEASAGYSYPVLLQQTGALALLVDDTVTSETLLRRAVDLDPLLPTARANLALAVAARGNDAGAEIEAAVALTRDPTWTDLGTDANQLLAEMRAASDAYLAQFPDRLPVVEGLNRAIDLERRRLSGDDPPAEPPPSDPLPTPPQTVSGG